MGWVFAIVITAIAGSFLQDLFLPKFLRQAEKPLMSEQPETTERSTLAMVLHEMETLGLIKLTPNQEPVVEGKPERQDQHASEKAAA